jgi:hypothetical protein
MGAADCPARGHQATGLSDIELACRIDRPETAAALAEARYDLTIRNCMIT